MLSRKQLWMKCIKHTKNPPVYIDDPPKKQVKFGLAYTVLIASRTDLPREIVHDLWFDDNDYQRFRQEILNELSISQ